MMEEGVGRMHDNFTSGGFGDEDGTEQARLIGNIFYALVAVVGIPGNVFVLLSIFCFREMRTISNIYIFNLALADLLFLLGTPFVVTQAFKKTWIFGDLMCKIFMAGNGISQFASAAFIGVLSFDRYLAVCRPVQATEWRTFKFAMIISSVAWTMVALEMTPLFVFAKVYPGDGSSEETCIIFWGNDIDPYDIDPETVKKLSDVELSRIVEERHHESMEQLHVSRRFFAAYTFALSYLLPLIAVWIFYANIIQRMWERRRHIWGRKKSMKRTTFRVSILGLAIVISYTLCWMPFWAVQWAIVTGAMFYDKWLIRASLAAYALQYVNSAANPFLYVFMSDAFKRNVSQMLRTTGTYQYRTPRSNNDAGETAVFLKNARTDSTTGNEETRNIQNL